MGSSISAKKFLIDSQLVQAARGDRLAWFELGICYSSGTGGATIDLIEAHKWFNLAAMSGLDRAQECRSDVATDMTPQEIAAAQRAARAWLRGNGISVN